MDEERYKRLRKIVRAELEKNPTGTTEEELKSRVKTEFCVGEDTKSYDNESFEQEFEVVRSEMYDSLEIEFITITVERAGLAHNAKSFCRLIS